MFAHPRLRTSRIVTLFSVDLMHWGASDPQVVCECDIGDAVEAIREDLVVEGVAGWLNGEGCIGHGNDLEIDRPPPQRSESAHVRFYKWLI